MKRHLMKYMAAVSLALAAVAGGTVASASADHAAPRVKFSGAYTLSYLSGNTHTLTATQCVIFTPVAKKVLSFSNAGTWVAATYPGFGGTFIRDGTDLRFYGTWNGGTNVISHHATVVAAGIKGGFADFLTATSTAVNDGRITLTAGCTATGRPASHSGTDPTR